jgi:hypothetical protein
VQLLDCFPGSRGLKQTASRSRSSFSASGLSAACRWQLAKGPESGRTVRPSNEPDKMYGRLKMGLAQYAIVPIRDQWGVLHDGNVNGEYATKESAFESAIAAASLAMRMGHEVHVSVPGRNEGEAALTQRAK